MILEEARIGEAAFSSPLSDLEVDVFFTLSPDEIAMIYDRRGDLNRLGLAVFGRKVLSWSFVQKRRFTLESGTFNLLSARAEFAS